MKKQNLFSSLLIGTVALSIALPSLVNADPSGTPPGGNVDATFNSVNAGYGTTAPSVGGDFQGEDAGIQGVATGASGFSGIFYGTNGISSEASSAAGMAAGFYNFAASPAVGVVLGYAGDALLASGPINLVGRIYSGSLDPTDKYVNIEDSDGVRFGDDAGTPQLTISGSTGDIADPNGDVTVADDLLSTGFSKANSGFRLTGSMGTFTMDQIGQMTRMYDNTTSPIQILDANGMDIRGPIANGSTFVDGNPVKIGEADGVLITSNGGTQGLTIAATGDIADTNSAVKFLDDQGLEIATTAGTVGLQLAANGDISNTDAGTAIPGFDTQYTTCTSSSKTATLIAGVPRCRQPVKVSGRGLDVQGSIISSVAGVPLMLSDADGIYLSGTGNGIFWIEPNGTTGEVTLHNENGGVVRFSGADNVIVGAAATGLQLEPDGTITKLGAGSVIVDDSLEVNSYTSLYGGLNVYSGATKNGVMDVSGNFRTKGVVTAGDADLLLGTAAPVTLDSSGIDVTGQISNGSATHSGDVYVNDDIDVTGKLTASTIGTYYFRYSTAHNLKNTADSCYLASNNRICSIASPTCDAGDRAVSWSSSGWSTAANDPKTAIFFPYLGTDYVSVYLDVQDPTSAPSAYSVKVLCWSTNT